MAKMSKKEAEKRYDNATDQDENEVNDEGQGDEGRSIFERLFAPASLDTSVSSDSNGDQSQDSRSYVSSLSGSSEGTDDDTSCSSLRSVQRFDRRLRAKHRSACKSMTVRSRR